MPSVPFIDTWASQQYTRLFMYGCMIASTTLAGLLLAASPGQVVAPTDSLAHDVGAFNILEPGPIVAAGVWVQPRVEVTNYGTQTERYFDVRFRIGDLYNETQTIASIGPGSVVTVHFPPWNAIPGSYTAKCSTMLTTDSNPGNDAVELSFAVLRTLRLHVGYDQSAPMPPDTTRDFLFYAELESDTAAFVSLDRVTVPTGWDAWLYDSTGRHPITELGRLRPNQRKFFNVRIRSPFSYQIGATAPEPVAVVVRAFCSSDTGVVGEALLKLTPSPVVFDVHNFPNPVLDYTTFQVDIPADGVATLAVYNRAGERIATILDRAELVAGFHFIPWRVENEYGELVAPGTYQYLLEYSSRGRTSWLTKRLVVTAE